MTFTPSPRLMLYGGLAVAAGLSVLFWNGHQQAIGKRDLQMQVADSVHQVKEAAAADSLAVARIAVANAVQARGAAEAQVRRAKAQQAHTDSAAQAAGDERAAALRLLADSLATVTLLRSEVARLVTVGVADSLAAALQRRADQGAIDSLTTAVTKGAEAGAKSLHAINAEIARAVAAEEQVRRLRATFPSAAGRWIERGAGVSVILYLLAHR